MADKFAQALFSYGTALKGYTGVDEAPEYRTPTLSYNYQRDDSFETEQRVSILTLAGRVIVPCIAEQYPHSIIGLEDLTHVRERTKRKRGNKASWKQWK